MQYSYSLVLARFHVCRKLTVLLRVTRPSLIVHCTCCILSDVLQQVADFVSRYMPAYKAYLSKLYSEAPGSATPDNTLRITVDRQRNPLV